MTDTASYAAFLPERHRSDAVALTSTWWEWRGRRVHIARAPNRDAQVRLLGIHGAGGYSGALWPFTSAAARQAEILVPDMPLYGHTVEPRPGRVRYGHWLDLLCDLVVAERTTDPRPLILFGASMGGMMAYETAARTGQADAVIVTCLLDPSDPDARAAAARWAAVGRTAPRTLPVASRVAGDVRLPIRWLTRMDRISNDPALSSLCASDPRGGGTRVPIGFLDSWFRYRHTPPEDYDGPPVTLVHPADDRWTPPFVSTRFADRIAAPTRTVMLDGCGHFPIEEPGLTQMREAVEDVARSLLA
ncbi:alpha/beta hydrolase [Rhodococcus sp. NPDC047139]|uniref:alpha/beta hydrolase n=1 Tax=Rhodococcus sp. NPDC047139 TaxID=3155141 RepID=UPI0033F02CB9